MNADITINDKNKWEYSVAYWNAMMDDDGVTSQWFIELTEDDYAEVYTEVYKVHTGDDTTEFDTYAGAIEFFTHAVNDAAPYIND